MKMSTVGKAFLAGSAVWLAHKTVQIKRQQDTECPDAIKAALMSSAMFQNVLRLTGSAAEAIEFLGLKGCSPEHFERMTGVSWPL